MRLTLVLGIIAFAVACSDSNGEDVVDLDVGGSDVHVMEDAHEEEDASLDAGADVSPDVDDGEEDIADEPDVCVPTSGAILCAEVDAECGLIVVDDGCEEDVSVPCGTCDHPQTCAANEVANRCGLEGWEHSVIDATGDSGREVSIVLSPEGYPRVAYQANIGGGTELRFAAFDGTSWMTETVDGGVLAGKHTAIAYDADGGLHIAATSFEGAILYSLEEDGQWSQDTISPTSRGRIGLAFDSDGSPHVCLHSESITVLLYYGRDEESGWISTVVDGSVATEARYGDYCSIATSPDGGVHIAYEDNQFRRLKYARHEAGQWSTELVDSESNDFLGTYISLALDSSGVPHISYRAGIIETPSIRLASWNDPQWAIETVDPSTGTISNFTSLAIDSSDNKHITYFDSSAGSIRYALSGGAVWTTSTLATVGTGGNVYSAIAVDETNSPHVVFYDREGNRLAYMRPIGE